MDAVLAEIDQLREGRPTAVRVLTMSNEFLADPGLVAMFGPDFGPEQGARIVAWQKQSFCRAAIRHHDLCVDLRPVLNGPAMDEPQDVNTQAAMQQVTDALLAAGLPELDSAEDAPAGTGRLVDIGSRELYLECHGAGRPVVVLEPGQGEPRSGLAAVQDLLAAETTVCTYDRANVGQSGSAPTPRTSADAVADLHALLARAGMPAPYVLAGTSAGGFIALHYARAHPDEVAGVLAINPPPLARPWAARAYPLLTPAERADEVAFYRGDNPESFDWSTSSSQSQALPTPRDVPMTLIHSSVTQCEGEIDGPCVKTAELYERLGADYAAAWPGATYRVLDAPHAVHSAEPALVARMIEDLITPAR